MIAPVDPYVAQVEAAQAAAEKARLTRAVEAARLVGLGYNREFVAGWLGREDTPTPRT